VTLLLVRRLLLAPQDGANITPRKKRIAPEIDRKVSAMILSVKNTWRRVPEDVSSSVDINDPRGAKTVRPRPEIQHTSSLRPYERVLTGLPENVAENLAILAQADHFERATNGWQ
jgi:hypothetical protein